MNISLEILISFTFPTYVGDALLSHLTCQYRFVHCAMCHSESRGVNSRLYYVTVCSFRDVDMHSSLFEAQGISWNNSGILRLELLVAFVNGLWLLKNQQLKFKVKNSSLYFFFQGARWVMSVTKMVPRSHEGCLNASASDINSAVGAKDD